MFETRLPNVAVVAGYVVMRMAMVVQWLRAANADPEHGATARRYAAGITFVQACWIAPLFAPQWWSIAFPAFVALELIVPAWAERAALTPAKDAEKARQLAPFSDWATRVSPENQEKFGWLLEEFRVSIFAQELGTAEPASAQRLRALGSFPA